MKKSLIISVLLLCYTIDGFSQKDSSKIQLLGDEKKVLIGNTKIDAVKSQEKKIPPVDIDLNNPDKIDEKAISNALNDKKPISNQPLVMEKLPKDKDIIEKKYWMGKDVTNLKLESNLSLGTINSKSKTVKIECRDHSAIDGDRIRIFLNEKVISSNLILDGNYFFVYINLEPGYNRIDFQALNQGFSGPNTAELIVYDETGTIISSKEWNLPTGAIATLGIIKN
ncbi:MAG: hypothetical protein Q8J84_10630 [Flavobacteriaceae bacterium]|nr:hypothetical protein [Flavobacteriaceae bacterium]